MSMLLVWASVSAPFDFVCTTRKPILGINADNVTPSMCVISYLDSIFSCFLYRTKFLTYSSLLLHMAALMDSASFGIRIN